MGTYILISLLSITVGSLLGYVVATREYNKNKQIKTQEKNKPVVNTGYSIYLLH